MKTKFSKLLSLIIAFSMLMSLIPFSIFASPSYVAQIQKSNGTYGSSYETFSAAVSAASAGDTIWLLKNDTASQKVVISKSLNIELQGYALKSTSIEISGSSTNVVINDRVGTGSINANHYTGFSTAHYRCVATLHVTNGATLTVNGVTGTDSTNGTIIYDCASDDLEKAVFVDGNSKLTINGGTFVASDGAGCDSLFVYDGTVTINDGYFYRAISYMTAPTDAKPLIIKKCTIDGGSGNAMWIEKSGSLNGVSFSSGYQSVEKIESVFLSSSAGSHVIDGSTMKLVKIGCDIYVNEEVKSSVLPDGTIYLVGSKNQSTPEISQPEAGKNVALAPQIAGGDGTAISYVWKKDGSVLSGETSSTLELSSVTAAANGVYSVTVSQSGVSLDLYYKVNVAAPTYTVKFNSNGGSGTMADQAISVGVATQLTANTFTKSGYKFAGWAESASGAKAYNDKESVTNLASEGQVKTLYAVWESQYKDYSIIKNDRAHAESVLSGLATVTEENGVIYIKLTSNVDGRIRFANDGSNENDGTFVLDLNGKTITAGTTNEALCIENYFAGKVTVTGEGTLKKGVNHSIYVGSGLTSTGGLYFKTAEGKDYFTLKNDSSNVLSEKNTGEKKVYSNQSGATVTLEQGVFVNYTVKFNSNGGSGTMADQLIDELTETALSKNTFTKPGYTFAGWAETASGSVKYNDQATVKDIAAAGQVKTLYAVWNKIPAAAPTVGVTPEGYTGANALTYGNITNKKLSATNNADTGTYNVSYQWYKNTSNSKTGATSVGSAKDYTLESNLNAGDYYYYCKITVTRKDNGDSVSKDTNLVKVTVNKAKPGVTAPVKVDGLVYDNTEKTLVTAGTTTGGTMEYSLDNVTYSTVLPKAINARDYTVYYRVTGDSNYNSVAAAYITSKIEKAEQAPPTTPCKVDETIIDKKDGFIKDVDTTMEYKATADTAYTPVTGTEIANLPAGTYLVRYKENENYKPGADLTLEILQGRFIKITFETNGGTTIDSLDLKYNEKITKPTDPEKDGYEYAGWYLDSSLSTGNDFNTNITDDTTLYVKWVKGTVAEESAVNYGVSAEGLNNIAKEVKENITLTVKPEEYQDSTVCNELKQTADKYRFFEFYDFAVTNDKDSSVVSASSDVVEIKLPYDYRRKTDIGVLRNNGTVTVFDKSEERLTSYQDGKFYCDSENGVIYIYTKKYAKFLIAYNLRPSSGENEVYTYKVTFETDGGTEIAPITVKRGEKVKEPETPVKEGYEFKGWKSDKDLKFTFDFNRGISFNTTIYAKWEEAEEHICPSEKFKDLDITMWYHEGTDFVLSNGIMKGTEADVFSPNGDLTRAMLVTMLYRIEKEPTVNYALTFDDVKDGAYYKEAVRWAQSEKIVLGYTDSEFMPDKSITREEAATIILRYAKYKGYDVSVGENTNILSYSDVADVSEYAIPSMQYSVGAGLIKGRTESTLNPKANITRAEMATVLQRFLTKN